MPSVLFRIAQTCIELERPQTRESLEEKLQAAAPLFGTTTFLLGVRGSIKATGQPAQLAVSNWPKAWRDRYDNQKLYESDPYLRRALSGLGPFRWDEVKTDEKGEAYKKLLAQEGGMVHGMICTNPPMSGFMGMLALAGKEPIARDTWPENSVALNLLSLAATRAAIALIEKTTPAPAAKPVELSGDERQCLELSAQGFTAKEVGKALGIVERTVRYHLDRAAEKLNVTNAREAVAEAIHRNLIHKRHFGPPTFKGAVK